MASNPFVVTKISSAVLTYFKIQKRQRELPFLGFSALPFGKVDYILIILHQFNVSQILSSELALDNGNKKTADFSADKNF